MDIIKNPSLQLLLGFGIAIAYIPGITAASVPTGWFFLIIIAPILFCFCKFEIGFGFLFIVYSALSLFWTENLNIGIFFLLQLIALGCIYCLGKNILDLKPVFKGISLGLGISSILAIAQAKGYTGVYTLSGNIAGLFLNPNIYSEVSAVILIALLSLKLFWYIPVTLPGIILVHSRTAMLSLAVGLFILVPKKFKLYVLIGYIIVAIILSYNYFLITSIQERLYLWADTIRGLALFGNGIGSFEILYPLHAIDIDTSIARPRYAHNDLLQLIFEAGVGVLFLIPVLWKAIKSGNAVLYSLAIVSFLTFPFHVPLLAFVGCLVAGYFSNSDGSLRYNGNSC